MPKLADQDSFDYTAPIPPVSQAAASKLAMSTSLNNYAAGMSNTNINIDASASIAATANAAAITTSGGAETSVTVDKTAEDWINKKWRPMMGWTYMATCIFDFIIAPVIWSAIQAKFSGQVAMQWQPLTLQGAGLYHVAMGAVIGVTAWGRTREKLENKHTE